MKFDRKKVIEKLEEKKALAPCQRCGQNNFSVLDQMTNFSVQEDTQGFVLGGATVPAALVICNHCGAITPHALGALGLLNSEEN
ncbi:hypothetical protein ACOX9X_11375 [Photobacterium leiognathi subsp. mandapamensis]|uniref:hypothetical protein n=1 Tax=Photobacterium leiognathi TaxID=553611 RepID=UPI003BF4E4A8